jgi:hypothetical protein
VQLKIVDVSKDSAVGGSLTDTILIPSKEPYQTFEGDCNIAIIAAMNSQVSQSDHSHVPNLPRSFGQVKQPDQWGSSTNTSFPAVDQGTWSTTGSGNRQERGREGDRRQGVKPADGFMISGPSYERSQRDERDRREERMRYPMEYAASQTLDGSNPRKSPLSSPDYLPAFSSSSTTSPYPSISPSSSSSSSGIGIDISSAHGKEYGKSEFVREPVPLSSMSNLSLDRKRELDEMRGGVKGQEMQRSGAATPVLMGAGFSSYPLDSQKPSESLGSGGHDRSLTHISYAASDVRHQDQRAAEREPEVLWNGGGNVMSVGSDSYFGTKGQASDSMFSVVPRERTDFSSAVSDRQPVDWGRPSEAATHNVPVAAPLNTPSTISPFDSSPSPSPSLPLSPSPSLSSYPPISMYSSPSPSSSALSAGAPVSSSSSAATEKVEGAVEIRDRISDPMSLHKDDPSTAKSGGTRKKRNLSPVTSEPSDQGLRFPPSSSSSSYSPYPFPSFSSPSPSSSSSSSSTARTASASLSSTSSTSASNDRRRNYDEFKQFLSP